MGTTTESVWDYPRPPALDPITEDIVVTFGGGVIARTDRAFRVLETSHPPTYYVPLASFTEGSLVPTAGSSFCEWKGRASYFALVSQPTAGPVAWLYADPSDRFAALHEHVSFYPEKIDCFVNGERVRPQPGSFYGGWITDDIVGPFKGAAGTGFW